MQKHTKIYLNHFGYGIEDFIPCEVCSNKAVDIHHIENRKMSSLKTKDHIENLMALCRSCHIEYGDKKQWMEFLIEKHKQRL
jgi:hypothetical protein